MPRLSKKERRLLAARELAKRQTSLAETSPITRAQLDDLFTFLSRTVYAHGHDGTYTLTERWIQEAGLERNAVLSFFRSRRFQNDWDVLVQGDSYKLFGPRDGRKARMPLSREQLVALIDWLDERLTQVGGCADDHKQTSEWLEAEGLDTPSAVFALLAQGGGCDCKVIFNVEPDAIFE